MSAYLKDPAAVLDYAVDWNDWLAVGETITAVDVVVPAGLTEGATTNAAGVVTVWLSGGTADVDYTVTFHITTSAARQDERSIRILVRDR